MNLYGLIGSPLGHSFSEKYFRNKFLTEQIADADFKLFPLKNITEFPDLITTYKNLKGLAVTIPYKEKIIPYLNSVSKEAAIIGAVNCIKNSKNNLEGFNTDAMGFEKSFKPLLKNHHTKALILGTGGGSKAVQYVLKKLSIPFLIVSRNANGNIINYEMINKKIIEEHTIIVNCTPVGLFPNENEAPAILYQYLTSSHLLYDLIYPPQGDDLQTKFLQYGTEKGATIKNGFEMLLILAEENWRIWNC